MQLKNTIIFVNLFLLAVCFMSSTVLCGQMPGQQGQSVYGNEWIDYEHSYLRIPVGADGWYTLDYNQIQKAGWTDDRLIGSSFVMYHNGRQVPIQVTTENIFSENDQIFFYGRRNKSELDHFLFFNPDKQLLNPEYSLFSDTSVYFLTIDVNLPKERYQEIDMANQSEVIGHVWTKKEVVFSDQFYTQASEGIIDPDFNDLEGFATAFGPTVEREIDMGDLLPSGDSIYLEVGVGTDLNTRSFSISVNDQKYKDYTNEAVQSARQIKLAWPVHDIGKTIKISVQGKENNDRVALAYVRVMHEMPADKYDPTTYPVFQVKSRELSYLLSIPEKTPVTRIYNLTQGLFFESKVNGGSRDFQLQGSSEDEYSVFRNLQPVENSKPVTFENYLEQPFDYLIITSDSLRRGSGETDPVTRYAEYRRSEAGGKFLVGVVTAEQLRDQYIYGIEGHPSAIRNFVGQLLDTQHGVRYVNIMGKGMGYGYLRSPADHERYYNKSHFVPTWGHYGSDNLLMAVKGQAVPRIPVGRIPATNSEEINNYLEKVKTYESVQQNPAQVEDRKWMKRVMHFNGGDLNIFSIISNFMDKRGSEIERDSFAAQLVSFYKSSFGSTEVPDREEIYSYINDGAALITFFGHSAASTLDFDIDIIEEYDNKGRLPVFLALGCSSGNIFLPQKNLAERFILTPDVGSVLFLSTATSEYLSNLQNLARNFYRETGSDQYGKPLGDIVKKTLEDLGSFQKHMQSVFVFTGDPAISTYHFDGPDFTFDNESVRLDPVRPSLVDESFTLEVDIRNLGRRLQDTFAVVVRQELPNGESRTLDTIWTNVDGFDHTLTLELPVTDNMEGKNTYYLTIDPDNTIEEYPSGVAEANNDLEQNGRQGFEVFIQNTTLQLIFPYKSAIIPEPKPVLEIFNGNVEVKTKQYLIELDTTPHFNSTGYRTFTRTSNQARIILPMETTLEEDVVYYWRARLAQDSVYTPHQSFIYLPDRTGWNQSHYGQFQQDSLDNLATDQDKLEFAHLQNSYKLDHGYKKAAITFNEIHRPRFFRSTSPALNVSIFKPRKDTWVLNSKPGIYNSLWPVAGDDYLFTFVYHPYNEAHRVSIIELIEKEAETGDYVIFWNTTNGRNSPQGDTWAMDSIDHQGVNLFNFFESEGATQIRELASEDKRAYSLIYKKGEGIVTEILGDSAGVNIEYVNLYSFVEEGQLWSGEVELLKSLDGWESGAMVTGSDSVDMTLHTGSVTEMMHFDRATSTVKSGSIASEGASSFSWHAKVRDIEDRTLPSMYWRVFGDFLPDWRITNSATHSLVDTAALLKNQLVIHFKIDSRGDPLADSVLVSVELFNGNRTMEHRFYVTKNKWGNDLQYDWPLGAEYNGPTVLKVTVDPDNEWREAKKTNNVVFRNFDIRGDRIAPTMEVLFDQQSILNGDIISPDALISVRFSDYPHQNLTAESDFEFEIRKPSGEILKIDSNDPQLTTEITEKGMDLLYRSKFDENGVYQLHVNVKDVVGNKQKSDYYIDFEVVLENSVSALLPYPNPFVDAVRFAYTLTGSSEPELFRVMIYTVSGRLVKEITKAEFGPMRIGRHLSDYVWDGTDNWNQPLAPGVYLYKVISRDSKGEEYEKYQIGELEQGNYFKNGIGKMVKLK